jgi:DMSO/TMAO reductase YedYZ molybdopterin-dependent catalytic subunit
MRSAPRINRRQFLERLAATGVITWGSIPIVATQSEVGLRHLLQLSAYPLDVETPLEALTSYVTPNDLFFIRTHWTPTRVNPSTWSLTVDGEVSRPLTLSLADLKALPRADVTCVLQCSGNGRNWFEPPVPGVQWRYGAVGNARWSGVRVRDVLARAAVKSVTQHLHTFGGNPPPGQVPPFNRSLEIDKALGDAIIAYEMNGEPLPHGHGGPVRLVVPGWAGDHWMKWLSRLSASREPQVGFYMETAYKYPIRPVRPGAGVSSADMRPITEMFVKSNITSAPSRIRLGERASLGGFAFSGAPDIARVEVSDDDGLTWRRARLNPQHDPYAWRLWSYDWTPSIRGTHRIAVRATDSRGQQQPKLPDWNPSGYLYNGWHMIAIDVE